MGYLSMAIHVVAHYPKASISSFAFVTSLSLSIDLQQFVRSKIEKKKFNIYIKIICSKDNFNIKNYLFKLFKYYFLQILKKKKLHKYEYIYIYIRQSAA